MLTLLGLLYKRESMQSDFIDDSLPVPSNDAWTHAHFTSYINWFLWQLQRNNIFILLPPVQYRYIHACRSDTLHVKYIANCKPSWSPVKSHVSFTPVIHPSPLLEHGFVKTTELHGISHSYIENRFRWILSSLGAIQKSHLGMREVEGWSFT